MALLYISFVKNSLCLKCFLYFLDYYMYFSSSNFVIHIVNILWVFSGGSDSKESVFNSGDLGLTVSREEPNNLATWCDELIHWKRSWCSKRLRAGREGATEDEMVEWHHQLSRHEFEQTQGDNERQGSLSCCGAWGQERTGLSK